MPPAACRGDVGLRIGELRFSHCYLCLGLIEGRYEGSRVYLEQELAFLDEKAVLVILLQQIALHFGRNFSVDGSIQLGNELLIGRHVPLNDVRDLDLRRR